MAASEFAPSEPIIQLHRNVVERLSREVWPALESQGMETGGLLLGEVDLQVGLIEIQDFAPLLCEDRPDHRFVLSDPERCALQKMLARGSTHDGKLKVVGCYRSQIGAGLTLDEEDLSFARACFNHTYGVFLLIQPVPNEDLSAGFFFWGDGQIDSAYTFQELPFDTRRLFNRPASHGTPSHPKTDAERIDKPSPVETVPSVRLEPPSVTVAAPTAASKPVDEPFQVELLFRDKPAEPEHQPLQALLGRARSVVGRGRQIFEQAASTLVLRASVWREHRFHLQWRPAEPENQPLQALLGRARSIVGRVRQIFEQAASTLVLRASVWREHRFHLQWRPLLAVVAVVLSMWGYRAYRTRTVAANAAGLDLQVERRGNDLHVSWNRNVAAFHHAVKGVLLIRDGDSPPRELPLDVDQLRSGRILYRPISTRVQFRLEVAEPDNAKTTETVFALARRDLGQGLAGRRQRAAAAPRDRKQLAHPAARAPKRDLPTGVAQVHHLEEAMSVPSRPPALLSKPAIPQPAPAPPAAAAQARATAQASGASPSHVEEQASSAAFVAARPIDETRPDLPASVRSTVTSPVEVRVKVRIDESGRAVRVDQVALTGPASISLVDATLSAALLWKFAPAMRGNQPIASEVVLTFSYAPVR